MIFECLKKTSSIFCKTSLYNRFYVDKHRFSITCSASPRKVDVRLDFLTSAFVLRTCWPGSAQRFRGIMLMLSEKVLLVSLVRKRLFISTVKAAKRASSDAPIERLTNISFFNTGLFYTDRFMNKFWLYSTAYLRCVPNCQTLRGVASFLAVDIISYPSLSKS